MQGKTIRMLLPVLALSVGIAAAACGTVATPEWAAEALETRAALAATSEHLTAIAPTATPVPPTMTPVPATATPIPATATPVPPTAAPPTSTLVPPTAAPATEEAATGSGDLAAAVAAADPANGQVIFTTPHDTDKGTWACAQCHSVTPDEMRIIGPGLWNVSVHGAMHVEGLSAIEYIHQSIVDPQAFITPGDPPFPENLMPQNWEQVLTPQELNDVIAYLTTLRD